MNKKLIISMLMVFVLVFSMVGVLAQGNRYITSNNYNEQKLMQVQNSFQNRYNFNCFGNCTYSEENDKLQLKVEDQVRVLNLFNLQTREEYTLDDNGEIINARYNIWSRLFNRENLVI